MKKLILLFIISALTWSANAQFVLTPKGLKSVKDSSDFVVFEFPNKTKEDLYKSTLLYFNKKYIDPESVIKTIENEMISVNGSIGVSIFEKKIRIKTYSFDIHCFYKILFKDGKIRIDSPNFILENNDMSILFNLQGKSLVYQGEGVLCFWDKKNQLVQPEAKKSVEMYFEKIIKEILAVCNEENKSDDW